MASKKQIVNQIHNALKSNGFNTEAPIEFDDWEQFHIHCPLYERTLDKTFNVEVNVEEIETDGKEINVRGTAVDYNNERVDFDTDELTVKALNEILDEVKEIKADKTE